MTITNMRMTSFRLSEAELGVVHGYRADPEFAIAWGDLRRRWIHRDPRRKHFYRLPYAALAQALCVLSGDFVCCQREAKGGEYIILSRRKLDPGNIRRALAAWELCLGESEPGALSGRVQTLEHRRIPVSDVVLRRPGQSPILDAEGNWPWDVAHWEVAHRLAETALRVEEERYVDLRLDSDGQLLTWSALVGPKGDGPRAMHVISPKIITIPGVEEPVVHLRASLVRLADDWDQARAANAWAELAGQHPIVLRASLRREKSSEDGSWSTVWKDDTAEILARSALDGPPDPRHDPPSSTGPLRAGFRRSPRRSSIGRGVGPWFYERVAHHARAALPHARPLDMGLIKRPPRSAETIAPGVTMESMPTRLRILCIYRDASTRRRQLEGLVAVLGEELHGLRNIDDNSTFEHGPLEVVFSKPPHSERLVERGNESMWEPWVNSWLPGLESKGASMAAFVQTDESAASARRNEDPKHALRHILGKRGIVSQFISETSAPTPTPDCPAPEDHPGENATLDLLRSAGWFLKTFPAEGVEAGILVVGIYCARATRKTTGKRTVYLANLVAAQAGSNESIGYVPERGWVPLHQATASFLGSEQSNTKQEAARIVERAVAQLRVAYRGRPVVLVFNAAGCRGHWRSLADKYAGDALPNWMIKGGSAVVRVRTTSGEVPRAAGQGDWPELASARHTYHRLLRVDDAQGLSPAFLFSGSKTMSRTIPQRHNTRFGCKAVSLKKDWHALRTTEIHVLEAGQFEARGVELELASMCRVGPSWEGQLRWPSPLHLARAVVRDHPHCVIEGEDDADLSTDD